MEAKADETNMGLGKPEQQKAFGALTRSRFVPHK